MHRTDPHTESEKDYDVELNEIDESNQHKQSCRQTASCPCDTGTRVPKMLGPALVMRLVNDGTRIGT